MNINDITTEVVHCKTKEQFEELCNFLAYINEDYNSLLNINAWDVYRENTGIPITKTITSYGSIDFYKSKSRIIISFEDIELTPKNWYLPLTDCNKEQLIELNEWRLRQFKCNYVDFDLNISLFLLSKHGTDNSYYYNGTANNLINEPWFKNYQKITIEHFYKYILKKTNKMNRFPFKLTIENARKIINIACVPWKIKLADKWSKDLLLYNYVSIEEDFYKEMREACDPDQNKLFDDIFGVDIQEIDLTKPETINNSALFDRLSASSLISIRNANNLKHKSFWLNDNYNWELKKDDYNVLCLVPTRK